LYRQTQHYSYHTAFGALLSPKLLANSLSHLRGVDAKPTATDVASDKLRQLGSLISFDNPRLSSHLKVISEGTEAHEYSIRTYQISNLDMLEIKIFEWLHYVL